MTRELDAPSGAGEAKEGLPRRGHPHHASPTHALPDHCLPVSQALTKNAVSDSADGAGDNVRSRRQKTTAPSTLAASAAGEARTRTRSQRQATIASPPSSPDLIEVIRSLHREHRALQRSVGDWDRRIKAEARWFAAARIRAAGGALDRKFPPVTPADEAAVRATRARFFTARTVTEEQRKACQRELLALVRQLPVADWIDGVRGLGLPSLAAVVGEAGDLGNYATVSRLWKRLGLAVIDGRAQRKVADPTQAKRQGYNPRRRAEISVIGTCLLKSKGEYKALYDERKAYELARAPEMRPKQAHRRAMRYMEKRLLKHLWQAWRRASKSTTERSVIYAPGSADGATTDSRSTRREPSAPSAFAAPAASPPPSSAARPC